MRYLFFGFCIIFSYLVNGQITILNRSLTDSTLNYLYIGIDNKIEIHGINRDHHVIITGGAASITTLGNNHYLVRVSSVTDLCEIQVANNGKIIFKKGYKVRPLSPIVAAVAGFRDTALKVAVLLANPFVITILPGCYFRHEFHVIRFQTGFVQNGDSIAIVTSGNRFSPEQIRTIKTLKSGDKIYFDDIYGLSPDSKSQHLPSFWIKIE